MVNYPMTHIRLKLFALMALLLTLGAASAATTGSESVSLEEQDNAYHIVGSFQVQADQSDVWQVLSDYGALKGVVSTMTSSEVLERRRSMVLVKQQIRGTFLVFSREISLTLVIDEWPENYMTFEEVSRQNFKFYRGSWTLEKSGDGVLVRYELDVSRGDMAPEFIEKGLFQDNALTLLKELKAEIVKRAAAHASGIKRP